MTNRDGWSAARALQELIDRTACGPDRDVLLRANDQLTALLARDRIAIAQMTATILAGQGPHAGAVNSATIAAVVTLAIDILITVDRAVGS